MNENMGMKLFGGGGLRAFMGAAVWLAALTAFGTSQAGEVVHMDDHSLPKATVRTFHVTCTGARFAVIRVDPSEKQICGAVQDNSKGAVCMVAADQAAQQATVNSIAQQLCR